MKKICIITTQSSSINFWIRAYFEHYKNNGYDITILTTYPEGFEETLPDYVKCKYVKMGRGVQVAGALKAVFEMWKFFRKEKFDIVQYSTPNASMYASIASFFAGIRCRLYCQWGIRYYEFTGAKRKFFKFIEKMTCSFSTHVSPASKANGEDSIKNGLTTREKVHTVWNGTADGIDFNVFDIKYRDEFQKKIRAEYGIPENAFVFGFLGRILWDKGVPELIEAFLELHEKYDNIYLMITGYFEREHMFDQDILRRSKECDHIFWTGRTEVPREYFATYDVFVFPVHREGGGGGVIRAAAMGTPSIVSDIGPLLNVTQNGETALTFKVRDKDDLKAQMEKIYLDNELREKLAKLQYQNAIENFERSKFVEHYFEYRNAIVEQTRKKK